jgi:hypothetical protein
MTMHAPTAPPMIRSAAAERMRAHRERRRQGLRCLIIELRETEIDALIRKGLLKAETRNNPTALSEVGMGRRDVVGSREQTASKEGDADDVSGQCPSS